MPFALKTANAWLFPGSEPALVDCGLGTSRVYEDLIGQIQGAGVQPGDLRLFVTHGHVDHAGNARRLHDEYGVKLHAPEAEAPFIETFRRDSVERNDAYAEALAAHGMPEETVRALRVDSDAIDRFLEDCPIDEDVPDGQRIVLGDMEAEAIHTPGHTDGSVCFYLSEDNDLLSGDTLLETITSNAGELLDQDHGSFHEYVETVEGLRQLVGVTCLPGHLPAFQLTDELIDTHLEHHRDRRARILEALDQPRTAWELFPTIFPGKNRGEHHFLGMAELVGHLHSLEIDGEVVRASAAPRRFVSATAEWSDVQAAET